MKTPSTFRPRRGFTLIELLVVISIIAVLAAAGFSVGTAALNRARKLSAQNTATALDQAVNMFFSEYGAFPTTAVAPAAGPLIVNTSEADGKAMLEILLGKSDEGSPNARGLSFFAAKEGQPRGTGGRDGLVYDDGGITIRGLYDPWGNGFTVVMDTLYDEFLLFTPSRDGEPITEEIRLNGRRVAVYSPGVLAGDEANLQNMVKTW